MKKCGPPMIDRRLKRKQTRSEIERDAIEDQYEELGKCFICGKGQLPQTHLILRCDACYRTSQHRGVDRQREWPIPWKDLQ